MSPFPTPQSYEAKGRRTLALRALLAPISAFRWWRFLNALHARVGAAPPASRALSKPLRSYLRNRLFPHQRLSILMETWRWLEAGFTPEFVKRLCGEGDQLVLAIKARKNSEYGIYLTGAVNAAMQREGEMAIYCARSPRDERLCRASFSFLTIEGRRALVIGGIQGPLGAYKREVIDATREMYGLRPKDAVLLAIRAFAAASDIEEVHAVSDARHVLTRLTNKTKFSNYDEYWRERGARCAGPYGYVFDPLGGVEPDGSKRDAVKAAIARTMTEFVAANARAGAYRPRSLSAAATSSSTPGSSMVAGIAHGS